MNKKTIFIPNKSNHNYDASKQFGTLVSVTEGNKDLYNLNGLMREMDILYESHSDDYILISGAPIINIIACSIFASLHGRLNLLLFKKDQTYCERKIVIK
jgi:hypothetical protein